GKAGAGASTPIRNWLLATGFSAFHVNPPHALEHVVHSRYLSAIAPPTRTPPGVNAVRRPPKKSESPRDTRLMETMKLSELKAKSPADLLTFAEEYEVENASTMRKQELMFAILKELAAREIEIVGEGVVEVLHDGFGFLRSPDANYLPGPDDI